MNPERSWSDVEKLSALDQLIDRVEHARKMGGAIPVTDALVQLLSAAVVDLAKEVRDA